jgi:dihydropteroate synthase
LGNIIINDVTGMNNPAMIDTVSRAKARVIVSHLPGADIQAAHKSDLIDSVDTVKNDLLAKAAELKERGVTDIILDPGIGFGKTPELNRKLVEFAREVPDFPVMIGYSRKRFLGDKRMELEPNLEAGRAAIAAGAAYLRVHDVAGHRQLLY